MEITKVCKDCEEEKPLNAFFKAKGYRLGVKSECKICYTKKQKEYTSPQTKYKYTKNWKKRNPDKTKKHAREGRRRNLSSRLAYGKHYHAKNRESINQKAREYRRKNPEKVSKSYRDWYERNRHKVYAKNAERRARLLKAKPKWLSTEQREQILNLYWLSLDLKKVTGQDYHVDHIVPLKGETVCGLHVPWNLQVLPSDLNHRKYNTYNEGDF